MTSRRSGPEPRRREYGNRPETDRLRLIATSPTTRAAAPLIMQEQTMDWHAKQVLEMAGIRAEDATEVEITLASRCIEECYYLQRAAERFVRIMRGPVFLHADS